MMSSFMIGMVVFDDILAYCSTSNRACNSLSIFTGEIPILSGRIKPLNMLSTALFSPHGPTSYAIVLWTKVDILDLLNLSVFHMISCVIIST